METTPARPESGDASPRGCRGVPLRSPIVSVGILLLAELVFRHAADESRMGSRLLSPAGSTGPVMLAAALLFTRLFVVWILPGIVAGWLLLRAWEAWRRRSSAPFRGR